MSKLDKALASLSRAFETIGLRWYVFGAQAAIFHGITRATADIDVTVDPGSHKTSEISTALEARGFRLRIDDPAFVDQTRVLPIVHRSPKDLEDVRGIVRANPKLDVALVRETLRLLEQALDQNDLLPVFERAWANRSR
jgi:hypothetical protein